MNTTNTKISKLKKIKFQQKSKKEVLNYNSNGLPIIQKLFNRLQTQDNFVIQHSSFKKINEIDNFFERDFDCIINTYGNKYYGMLKDDPLVRQGVGLYFYPNKDIYFGEWADNHKKGRGIYIQNTKKIIDDEANKNNEAFRILIGKDVEEFDIDGIIIDYEYYAPTSIERSLFTAYIGVISEGNFTKGFIYSKISTEEYIIYYGSVNEDGLRDDENGYFFQSKTDSIYHGSFVKDRPYNGYLCKISKNYDKLDFIYEIFEGEFKESLTRDASLTKRILNIAKFIVEQKDFYKIDYNSNEKQSIEIFAAIHNYTNSIIDLIGNVQSSSKFMSLDEIKLNDFLSSYLEIIKSLKYNEGSEEEEDESNSTVKEKFIGDDTD